MNNGQQLKETARAEARAMLSQSAAFHGMPKNEQMALYKDMVSASYNRLAEQAGLRPASNGGLASALADNKDPEKASDLIDDERHKNDRIDDLGDIASDFVQAVNFPVFVKDLLKGVFDANLEVTLAQMESYQELLKTATQSLSKFIKDIDDTAAFGYLVDNNSDEFSMQFPDGGGMEGDQVILTDKDGNPVDTTDSKIKAKIMDSKIQMAREQRAMLRETILMGITRLVVEKGTVKAGVLFDFKANENIVKNDQAHLKKQKTKITRKGGGLSRLWGGKRSATRERSTAITVSSARSVSNTSLAAKLTGEVEIIFKSDYFKLDNFAEMYGPIKPEEKAAAAGS